MSRQMKDSGIPWIGQVPEHWEQALIGSLYKLRNTKVSDKQFEPLSVTMRGILHQLENAAKTNDGDNRKLVKQGDFVINSRSDRRGACGISKYDGSVSLINLVLVPQNHMNPGYYNWLFHTSAFADEFYKWGHGIVDDLWTTRWQDMKNITIPLPSLQEQQRIAEYLDKKCAEIDTLSNSIQQQIDTLEQYKRAVITETVTKGFHPSVPMKDSGIPWIGQIPAHWDCHPLYYYFTERKRPNKFGKETNLLSLSYGKVIKKDINTCEGLLPASYNSYNILDPLDIVLRLTDLQNDKRSLRTGLAHERGIITSAYVTIKPARQVVPAFFHYLLHAYDVGKVLYNMGNGVRQSLNYAELSKLPLIEPTIKEQQAIAEYLDKKCAKIDGIIQAKQQQLEELEQYKKAIIFEYVTGKKQVPEVI